MSPWIAFVSFALVQGLGWYLLRASRTWAVLFGPFVDVAPDAGLDRLLAGDREWIDNHSFWELDDTEDEQSDDAAIIFWGSPQSEAG